MAESDADRRAGTVSTEEAERLSERFRPSWEDDPPTVPREPLAPRAPAPVVAVPIASPAAAPPPVSERIPTLAGIPAPASSGDTRPPGDDLDWDVEVPTRPVPPAAELEATLAPGDVAPAIRPQPTPVVAVGTGTVKLPAALPAEQPAAAPTPSEPEATFHVEIEELPPESKPSGIGEKYVPKEEGAPPVVLNEDVRVAELGAQAERDAQHRARRAPTIARLKAIELPTSLDAAEPFAPPPKSGAGRVIGVALVLLVAAGGAAALLVRSKPTDEHADAPAGPAAVKVVPDTAAPPPPALTADTAATAANPPSATSAEPSSADAPSVAPVTPEPSAAPPLEPPPEATAHSKTKPATPAPKPGAASRPAPAPKTTATAAKPAAKPVAASKPPAGKGVIVRDTPF